MTTTARHARPQQVCEFSGSAATHTAPRQHAAVRHTMLCLSHAIWLVFQTSDNGDRKLRQPRVHTSEEISRKMISGSRVADTGDSEEKIWQRSVQIRKFSVLLLFCSFRRGGIWAGSLETGQPDNNTGIGMQKKEGAGDAVVACAVCGVLSTECDVFVLGAYIGRDHTTGHTCWKSIHTVLLGGGEGAGGRGGAQGHRSYAYNNTWHQT